MRMYLILLTAILIGGCYPKYEMGKSEEIYYLSSSYNGNFLYDFYDSVASFKRWNQHKGIDSSYFNNEILNHHYRIYTLKTKPFYEEYMVGHYMGQAYIHLVYDSKNQIRSANNLSNNEKERIAERYLHEVVYPMIEWGRKHGVNDTLMVE